MNTCRPDVHLLIGTVGSIFLRKKVGMMGYLKTRFEFENKINNVQGLVLALLTVTDSS
jgi:hypothetical protein